MYRTGTTEIGDGKYNKLTEQPEQVRILNMIFYNYALFATILTMILCSMYLVYLLHPIFVPKCIFSYKNLLHYISHLKRVDIFHKSTFYTQISELKLKPTSFYHGIIQCCFIGKFLFSLKAHHFPVTFQNCLHKISMILESLKSQ